MFTGLINGIGVIKSVRIEGNGMYMNITVDKSFLDGINTGDSIAVDGACLTVTKTENNGFMVFAMKETLDRTILKQGTKLKNRSVNLEKSLKVGDKLDGHLVYGHIDFTSKVDSIRTEGYAKIVKFNLPSQYKKYVVKKGSIAINGVSLTVKDIDLSSFSVSLIPETQKRTNLNRLNPGDMVNVELDIIGKYIENFIKR